MKINKHINILLACLILLSNMGLAFNVHYCKDEISSVKLVYKVNEPCAKPAKSKSHSCCAGAGESHKKCCKNNIVKLQDTNDNIIVKSLQLNLDAFIPAIQWQPLVFNSSVPVKLHQEPAFYCKNHAPPLYKLYCRYILYA